MLKWKLQQFAEDNNPPKDDDKPPVDDKNPPKEPEKVVPYDRFAEVNSKKKELEEQVKRYSEFGDAETLAQKLARLAELEKASEEAEKAKLSEIERAQLEAKQAAEKLAEYERKAQEIEEKRKQDLIRFEFGLKAKDAEVVNVEDALRLADLSGVKVTENGTVEGIDEVIKALKENKPYLFGAKKEPKQIGDANNPAGDKSQKTAEQLLKEAEEKARRSGRIEDRIAYAQLKKDLGK